jgi:hypothetical protein
VVIEPPGNFGRSRIFEVDDSVFVAAKIALVKERSGAVHQAVVLVTGARGDALAVKAREEGGRTSSIKAFVVIEDANPQTCNPPESRNQ